MEKEKNVIFEAFARKAAERIEERKKLRTMRLMVKSVGMEVEIRGLTEEEIRDCMDFSDESIEVDKYTIYMREMAELFGAEQPELDRLEGILTELLEKVRCACEQERDLAIVEFLYSSAVRVSELCRLNRDDICWESDDVMVLGKGNKEREVYLNARAHLHLRQYLESRTDDNPALFVGTRAPHERLTKSGVRNILKKIGSAAGVSKVHPHRFRRTSATDLLRMGMPIEQVQELLGHVKIETTRIYCTVTKEQVRASHRRFMAA